MAETKTVLYSDDRQGIVICEDHLWDSDIYVFKRLTEKDLASYAVAIRHANEINHMNLSETMTCEECREG